MSKVSTTAPATWQIGNTTDRVTISAQGGALLSWEHAGQKMLAGPRKPDPARIDPLECASFPLVPYSNRIKDARFDWNGAPRVLRRNFAPEPHAIHGSGWQRKWQLAERSEDRVVIELRQETDVDWPWPFVARQEVTIDAGRLHLRLSATNLADIPVPLAFGHHPYFSADGAQLRFGAMRVWSGGAEDLLGTAALPRGDLCFADGPAVSGRNVDHCYEGWDGQAEVTWRGAAFKLTLSASASLPCAVVYIPRDGDRFCFEPVPHATNALHRADSCQVPTMLPGQTFSAEFEMCAVAV